MKIFTLLTLRVEREREREHHFHAFTRASVYGAEESDASDAASNFGPDLTLFTRASGLGTSF